MQEGTGLLEGLSALELLSSLLPMKLPPMQRPCYETCNSGRVLGRIHKCIYLLG